MHLYTRIALLMAIGSVVKCSAVLNEMSQDHLTLREGKDISQDQETHIEGKEISLDHESYRDGRRISSKRTILEPLLNLIDFNDANCTEGICVSHKECGNMEGFEPVPGIRCAGGFGVCCVDGSIETTLPPVTAPPYTGGDVVIGPDGGDFFNAGDGVTGEVISDVRQDSSDIVIKATLNPAASAVQIKIDIESLDILGPTEGECSNDSLVITSVNPGLEIPILCGKVTNQTLYIGIDNSGGSQTITLTIDTSVIELRTWYISISFLTAADAVPARCLQYLTEPSGTIQSLNFQGSDGHLINDQTYSICFKYISGICDVGFTFQRLDIGNINGACDDTFLLIGTQRICGDVIDYTVTGNSSLSGGSTVNVITGSENNELTEGFKATYTMMEC